MNRQLVKSIGNLTARLSRCQISTSAVLGNQSAVLGQEARDKIHPRIGNREIVGFGINGSASYFDIPEIPFPAIRFKESTGENLALLDKQAADWKTLTLQEKKDLYRISFCQTYAEMHAPTGDWKRIISFFLMSCSLTGWIIIWMKLYVYPPVPHSLTQEWQDAMLEKMIAQRVNPIEGVSSQYDYENERWKN
ncbi:cytochrome c oxidase subunit 4 isoform 1, mitochondrial-like [Octopus vulgaris]|uniref:Cytochrome c oxidase subunit 4 isoform 1, mitochondrial-like n=2 Tax=Octopus TaxID=6643 RepID=A0AA36EXS4_OCTVU|nr:cytochrome c oxidase subunit 4 isoform 1, mitochondrial [Octopus sinensis]XP_036360386.1 cytochrome c oxidase subunit 4 isoform 1, mitochondrial [Octopus sinensis]CAI9715883.1 cytochrome c oxidase subunit 4 isoform 1, mitochondrial-like [Octopus vulgaris]